MFDHLVYFFLRNVTVKDDGIPMVLIQMKGRNHRRIGLTPELQGTRFTFYIDPNMAVLFKDPRKYFIGVHMPHYGPIFITKRSIFIGSSQTQTIINGFLSSFQANPHLAIPFSKHSPRLKPMPAYQVIPSFHSGVAQLPGTAVHLSALRNKQQQVIAVDHPHWN